MNLKIPNEAAVEPITICFAAGVAESTATVTVDWPAKVIAWPLVEPQEIAVKDVAPEAEQAVKIDAGPTDPEADESESA